MLGMKSELDEGKRKVNQILKNSNCAVSCPKELVDAMQVDVTDLKRSFAVPLWFH